MKANIPPLNEDDEEWWTYPKYAKRDFLRNLKTKKPIFKELLVKVVSVPCVTRQPVNTTLRQNNIIVDDDWIHFCNNQDYFLNIILIKMNNYFGTQMEHDNRGEGDIGNNSLSPSPKKRINPSCYWLFTCFDVPNGTQILNMLKSSDETESLIAGLEHCPSSKREHLQGFVSFKKRVRPLEHSILKLMPSTHWIRKSKKSTIQDNYDYCTKDGNIIVNKGFASPIKYISLSDLNNDQKELVLPFQKECSATDRSINYFWESEGGWGKSLCAKYFVDNYSAICVGGNSSDIFYGLKKFKEERGTFPSILIQDLSRSEAHKFNATALEKVKDGLIFSTKYESGMMRLPPIHIIVFSNSSPNVSELSCDRWNIKHLTTPAVLNEEDGIPDN